MFNYRKLFSGTQLDDKTIKVSCVYHENTLEKQHQKTPLENQQTEYTDGLKKTKSARHGGTCLEFLHTGKLRHEDPKFEPSQDNSTRTCYRINILKGWGCGTVQRCSVQSSVSRDQNVSIAITGAAVAYSRTVISMQYTVKLKKGQETLKHLYHHPAKKLQRNTEQPIHNIKH